MNVHPPLDTGPQLRSDVTTVAQDWPRLAAYLAAQGMSLSLDPVPRQFSGGLANLNYLLLVDGTEAVLRRPPMGILPPGAYDMGGEFCILRHLAGVMTDVLATLHAVDPAAVGLSDLGRPDGFLERAMEGWIKRALLSAEGRRVARGRQVGASARGPGRHG